MTAHIMAVDGNDSAFYDFDAPRDSTVPQTFTFAPAPVDRTATMALMVGSIHSPWEHQPDPLHRPHVVSYTTGAVTETLIKPLHRPGRRRMGRRDLRGHPSPPEPPI